MRIAAMTAGLAMVLAGAAGAGCLPDGQMPTAVHFADGAVIDHITREGDMLSYTSYDSQGEAMQTSALWGLYPDHAAYHGEGVKYDWHGAKMPAPADLVPGQEVDLSGHQVMNGTSQPIVMALRLVGPETVQVGDCSYQVLHLQLRMGPDDGARVEGERWLDPARLVMWATKTRILDKDGNLDREVSSQAIGAE